MLFLFFSLILIIVCDKMEFAKKINSQKRNESWNIKTLDMETDKL